MSGLDVAFVHNGYVYHTDHDDLSRIEPGSVQRAGENLLAVVKSVRTKKNHGGCYNNVTL